MKRDIILVFIFTFVLAIYGCSSDRTISGRISQESMKQSNIFKEMTDDIVVNGYSILIIRTEVKTVKEDFYPLEAGEHFHGKPEYPFEFSIGGQRAEWMAKGQHDIQKTTIDGKRNPEGGEGMKYLLEKKIVLKAGTYKIHIDLTEEKFKKEVTITLLEGKKNVIEFAPLYSPGRNNRNIGSFYRGLKDFKVFFNGMRIADVSN